MKLLDGQKKTNSAIEGILATQTNIENKLSGLAERIDGIERQLTTLKDLPTKVCNVESAMSNIGKELDSLRNQVDGLENRSRRNNLIIYGFDEPSKETNVELEN